MKLSAALLSRGFFVQGIRPPTVPDGTSRLRIVPTAAHSTEQVDALLAAFHELRLNHG
jgi:7-keto-8-aminopelargonate synthetase-like enzyme